MQLAGVIKNLRHLHTLRNRKRQEHSPDAHVIDAMSQQLMDITESLQLVQMDRFQKRRGQALAARQVGLPWDEWMEGL